jgi:hypothetical protein
MIDAPGGCAPMTDDDWKTALEILVDIRQSMAHISADLTEIEQAFDRIEAHIDATAAILAEMNGRGPRRIGSVFDRIECRIDRIERHLDLHPLQV